MIIFDAKRKEALIQNKMPNIFGLAFKHDDGIKCTKKKPHVTFFLLGTPDEYKFINPTDFGSLPSGKELIKKGWKREAL